MKINEKNKKSASAKAKAPAKIASKTTSKIVAKPKKSAAVATKAKAPVKATKIAVKAKAAPVKAATKTVAKKAVAAKTPAKSTKTAKAVVVAKAPTNKKAVQTTKAKPIQAVKAVAAKTSKKVATPAAVTPVKAVATLAQKAKSTVAAPSPIVIKMPDNQNAAATMPTSIISTGRTSVQTLAPQKSAGSDNRITGADTAAAARPVYRPIQVINKPLAPTQPVRQMAPISKADEKVEFKKGDYVVYPAHGVGEIDAVETQIIGGMEIKLYAISFEKDRMRLKVPVFKAHASGLRRLSSQNQMQDAIKTLQGRAQIRRTMWSRRAQEYETKINSGDPVSIAEVLRDLKRSNDDTEQSYSERQIYQSALERLAREVAALDKITEIEAASKIENMIKGRRSRNAAATPAAEQDVAADVAA